MNAEVVIPDEIMTVEEVAEYLRVHPSTIYRMLRHGEIPAFRVGSDWRFHRNVISKWILALPSSLK